MATQWTLGIRCFWSPNWDYRHTLLCPIFMWVLRAWPPIPQFPQQALCWQTFPQSQFPHFCFVKDLGQEYGPVGEGTCFQASDMSLGTQWERTVSHKSSSDAVPCVVWVLELWLGAVRGWRKNRHTDTGKVGLGVYWCAHSYGLALLPLATWNLSVFIRYSRGVWIS